MSEEKTITIDPKKVQEIQRLHLKILEEHPEKWRKPMEDQFQERSQGRIRAFHTLYPTIESLMDQKSKFYAIGEQELESLYIGEKQKILELGHNSYCYLFAIGDSKGFLVAASYLHY